MVSEWQRIPIKNVYEGLFDGPHATPKPSESGPIFLGIKNVGETGQLDFSDTRHISEEEYHLWIKRVEPRYGDIVFSYEATLNRYAMIPKGLRCCLGRRMALVRPDESRACGKFLYYSFFGREWRNVIAQNTLIGSTVDRIPISQFPDFPINIPPLPIQHKIASILSAYDELIENNTRRIKILEEMARSIYREWFINFRYPEHEKVKMVDSPLGKIPEGWERTPFSALARYVNGYAFKPDDWGKEGKPIIKIKELKAGITTETPRNMGYGIPEKYNISDGDVLFSWSADLDAYLWRGGSGLLNQHLFNVVPFDSFSRSFCFYALKEQMPRFRALSLGATMHHIKRSALDQVYSVVPTLELRMWFDTLVEPIHGQLITLNKLVLTLIQTRDLLLPRLVSGELDVTDLDIQAPEELS